MRAPRVEYALFVLDEPRIVPPRPPRARELDADPTRPQSIAAVSVRATATAKKPTAIAAGGDYALELEFATDAVRMATAICARRSRASSCARTSRP